MEELLLIFLKLAILLLTIVSGLYFRRHIRPIALVNRNNEMNVVEQFQQNIINAQSVNQLSMRSVTNPFAIFTNLVKSSTQNGVYLRLKVTENNRPANSTINLIVAWCVRINDFYRQIEQPTSETFYSPHDESKFLKRISLSHSHEIISDLDKLNEREFYFKTPVECEQAFSEMQTSTGVRSVFHLVVAVYRNQTEMASLSPDDIIADVDVYHLKDAKMDTKQIYSFVKFKNNSVANLNKVFNSQDDNLCVVCQSNQADQVLLPCSHKCLCSECVTRIERKCPVCRTIISNKFEMN